ncbi:hypothetical protein [Streptomyces uncialis]|uniref:hypothetical protein n=1 Tax=Streptomyces uncialis TaxID=1048205 RepID=UPI0033CF22D3
MKIGNLRSIPHVLIGMVAAMGIMLFAATPANAHPLWQTYSANSNWECGLSKNISISNSVVFQTCLITTPNKAKAQLVLVVSNRSTKAVQLRGGQFDSDLYGVADFNSDLGGGFCGSYTLAAGQARGCFGETVDYGCGVGQVHRGVLYANAADEDWTYPFSTDHYC